MGTSASVPNSQVSIGCQLCQGKNTIQWKCVNCQFLMCSSCKDNIHLRIAKDHIIRNLNDIGELDSGESFNFCDVHCNEHSNQVCCSYCRTCKNVVCLKCVMKVHNGHEFVDEEEFLGKKKKLWEGHKNAVTKLSELSTEEHKWRNIKESEEAMYNKAKENIQNRSINDGDRWSEKLIDLEEIKRSINQEIDRELRNLAEDKRKFQEVINVVDLIKSSKDFYKFFERFKELLTSLNYVIVPFKSNIGSLSDFIEGENLVSESCRLKTNHSGSTHIFKVVQQYTTDIRKISLLTELPDQTLLISDNSSKVLQHVNLEGTSVQVKSNMTIKIFGMAVSPAGDILVSTSGTRLKILNLKTGEITDSVFNVHPLKALFLHATRDHRVIIGARSPEHKYSDTGRCVVIVMNQEGKYLKEYEHDGKNKSLFTYPRSISSTSDDRIFVVDRVNDDARGRVVVLARGGEIIQIYSGHPHINTERKPFKPVYVSTISSERIIVTELETNAVHILNNYGHFITFYNILDIGIERPYSLALSSSGHLYLGCTCKHGSPDTFMSKLYELEYSGI
ncbi:E3 ubiquitin-protein ligase TRIM71-like [Mytilus trossulus]|uniref:E3 ubiquitin-protein ligase TRIM71-like n=1 Tax=Mytilus trossulus TaxID=6551 RepID=UPI003003D5F3